MPRYLLRLLLAASLAFQGSVLAGAIDRSFEDLDVDNTTIDATTDLSLHPRVAGEGVHFINCISAYGDKYSAVTYCARDADCSNRDYNFPDPDRQYCHPGLDSANKYVFWETGGQKPPPGQTKFCTFKAGTTFSWEINANAQSRPDYTQVG
ncbi:hypothetical protein GE09DRAFT_1228206 [Coniochaeta sp. 2T2.1]|nr:hypothetical protein GE09DRAFT_1228206 [Coniochaeta sp. 2T2.1]